MGKHFCLPLNKSTRSNAKIVGRRVAEVLNALEVFETSPEIIAGDITPYLASAKKHLLARLSLEGWVVERSEATGKWKVKPSNKQYQQE